MTKPKTQVPPYYALGEKDYELYVNGVLTASGHQADVREKIESLLETATNTWMSLQEDTEDGYLVYLHSDNEDMDQDDNDMLHKAGLTFEMTPEEQTSVIKALCNITEIKEVVY